MRESLRFNVACAGVRFLGSRSLSGHSSSRFRAPSPTTASHQLLIIHALPPIHLPTSTTPTPTSPSPSHNTQPPKMSLDDELLMLAGEDSDDDARPSSPAPSSPKKRARPTPKRSRKKARRDSHSDGSQTAQCVAPRHRPSRHPPS